MGGGVVHGKKKKEEHSFPAPSYFSLRKSYPTEGLMPCTQWLPRGSRHNRTPHLVFSTSLGWRDTCARVRCMPRETERRKRLRESEKVESSFVCFFWFGWFFYQNEDCGLSS